MHYLVDYSPIATLYGNIAIPLTLCVYAFEILPLAPTKVIRSTILYFETIHDLFCVASVQLPPVLVCRTVRRQPRKFHLFDCLETGNETGGQMKEFIIIVMF
jgi:hypothetical protein